MGGRSRSADRRLSPHQERGDRLARDPTTGARDRGALWVLHRTRRTRASELRDAGGHRAARGSQVGVVMRTVLPDLLREAATAAPENIAVVDGAQAVTYAELDERSNRLAHF